MRPVAPRTGAHEITVAEEQEQYSPLVVARYVRPEGVALVSRWRFSDEERAAIARGEDLFLMQLTFGLPMQPLSPTVGPQEWMVEP